MCFTLVNEIQISFQVTGGVAAVTARPTPLDPYTSYGAQQSYQSSSYPYGNYMSSFGAHYGTTAASAAAAYPYDRTSMYSTYGAAGPKAFVPHSAINLSVKTPELPESASTLDLSMTDQSQQQVCVRAVK